MHLCCLRRARPPQGFEACPGPNDDSLLSLATTSQFAKYARRAPRRYEHPCKETRLGRPGTCLQLNVKVEVFVYEKHENSGISKAQITHNRAQMRALRQVVGADWAFLEEDDVDDILRRKGESDDDFDRRPPVFRWNFA